MTNPYVQQIMDQTAMTAAEVRKNLRPAQRRPLPPGYDNWDSYYEAIAEFLNGQ